MKSSLDKIMNDEDNNMEFIHKYCNSEHRHTDNKPIDGNKDYWTQLKEGCEVICMQEDLIKMI